MFIFPLFLSHSASVQEIVIHLDLVFDFMCPSMFCFHLTCFVNVISHSSRCHTFNPPLDRICHRLQISTMRLSRRSPLISRGLGAAWTIGACADTQHWDRHAQWARPWESPLETASAHSQLVQYHLCLPRFCPNLSPGEICCWEASYVAIVRPFPSM